MQYKPNSIIFFQGDVSDKIYILKSGKVSLNSKDIETGQEIRDLIQTGEFFGVKSALGKYPREETAVVLSEASVVQFSVPEFEQLAMSNTRIIMKMLKVFSNQLRRIHKQVRNLLSTGEQLNAEEGLFRIGEYYFKNKRYAQALYALRRYLTYYPTGQYADEATRNIEVAERYSQQYGDGKGPAPVQAVAPAAAASKPEKGKELSDVARIYYDAVSLFSQQKFAEALKAFKSIAEQTADPEYSAKSEFEVGRCMFSMNDFDACIAHFTGLVKYPKHPDLLDALFYVGKSYEKKEDKTKAAGFYKKILSMAAEDDQVARKVKKALRELEGGK